MYKFCCGSRSRPVLVGFAWSTASAFAIAALGVAPSPILASAAAAAAGFALGPAGALLIGTVQATTDPGYLGRVMSMVSLASFGLTPLGLTSFGYLTELLGASGSMAVTGTAVATVATLGVCTRWARQVEVAKASAP